MRDLDRDAGTRNGARNSIGDLRITEVRLPYQPSPDWRKFRKTANNRVYCLVNQYRQTDTRYTCKNDVHERRGYDTRALPSCYSVPDARCIETRWTHGSPSHATFWPIDTSFNTTKRFDRKRRSRHLPGS